MVHGGVTLSTSGSDSGRDLEAVGHYRIEAQLGRGGMGTVYRARSPDGRLVAVKIIRSEIAALPEYVERFRREGELACRVARFCTAEVLDVGYDNGCHYLVTEYIPGPTLARVIMEEGPMAPADLERLALSVANALVAIHGAGLAHRDLKPSNIILSRFGPRVIDFGIAKVTDATENVLTLAGTTLGTPAYLAPEQALGRDTVTEAVDIFAWGGTVTFAGTGTAPFGDASTPTPTLLYRAAYETPRTDGLPPRLREIVERAMAKDPTGRPTAKELYRLLTASIPNAHSDLDWQPTHPALDVPGPRPAVPAGRFGPAAPVDAAATETAADGRAALVRESAAEDGAADQSPSGTPPSDRRQQIIAALLAVALVGVLVPAAWFLLRSPKSTPSHEAVSERIAAQASEALVSDPILARKLSLAAYRLSPTPAAFRALVGAFGVTETSALDGGSPLVGLATRPDGNLLALGTADGRIGLWDIADLSRPVLAASIVAHVGQVWSVAFSVDGRKLVSYADDHAAKLWDVGDPTRPLLLSQVGGQVNSVALSSDGTTLATASPDHTAELWDISSPAQPHSLSRITGHTDWVTSVAFSPDGRLLATGSYDRTARLWDVTTPAAPRPLGIARGHEDAVLHVGFSPDGRLLGTAGPDKTARVWDIADTSRPTQLTMFDDHGSWITSIDFSSQYGMISTSSGNTTRLWDASNPREPTLLANLAGHQDSTRRAGFSQDSTFLVSISDDQTARLWSLSPADLVRQACADPANVLSQQDWRTYVGAEVPYLKTC